MKHFLERECAGLRLHDTLRLTDLPGKSPCAPDASRTVCWVTEI
jgi:hypothetical protein